jgi:hypothetical protein
MYILINANISNMAFGGLVKKGEKYTVAFLMLLNSCFNMPSGEVIIDT